MPEITVRKADGTLTKIIVNDDFVEKMHDNWKCQMDVNGCDSEGMKKKEKPNDSK